jgi:hypothetical protein
MNTLIVMAAVVVAAFTIGFMAGKDHCEYPRDKRG